MVNINFSVQQIVELGEYIGKSIAKMINHYLDYLDTCAIEIQCPKQRNFAKELHAMRLNRRPPQKKQKIIEILMDKPPHQIRSETTC